MIYYLTSTNFTQHQKAGKRKVEIDLTDIEDIKSLNIVENEIGSMTSQCTDDLSSNDGDDDDDGSIDDILDFITNDKNKNKTDETDGKIKAVQKIGKNTY